jgi:hypothetical protein
VAWSTAFAPADDQRHCRSNPAGFAQVTPLTAPRSRRRPHGVAGFQHLTSSGIDKTIEAGILVHGGTAPVPVVEHCAELTAAGVLIRL